MTVAPMLLIKASAGTGKTYQLSAQFLELILKGAPPDSILATTFTRKAAGEIRSRIFSRLVDAVISGEKIDSGYGAQRQEEALERLLSFHHRLSIGTLDSFFISLAKLFPFELGLPANFTMLGEEERATHWAEVLEVLLMQCSPTELLDTLSEISPDVFVSSMANVTGTLSPLYELFSSVDPEVWCRIDGGRVCSEQELSALVAAVTKEGFCPVSSKNKKPNGHWLKAVTTLVQSIKEKDYRAILEKGLTGSVFSGTMQYHSLLVEEDHQLALVPIVEHARAMLLDRYNKKTKGIREFLVKLSLARNSLLAKGSGWGFSDITRAVAAVLKDEPLHTIFYRLDTLIHHVMLDEFQDTSREQFNILYPFIDELASKADGTQASFFCVGDGKQAIYSWRGGDKRVFDSLSSYWPHMSVKTMSVCRRCRSAILDATNDIFLQVKNIPELGHAGSLVSENYEAHLAFEKEEQGEVLIRRFITEREDDRDEDKEELLFKDVLSRIKELQQKNYCNLAILTRDKKQIAQSVQYLKAHGIKARDESSGVLITESPIVALFISLLKFLDFPEKRSAYLYHLLHSPLKKEIADYASPELFATAVRSGISGAGGSLEKTLRALTKHFDAELLQYDSCLAEFWSYIATKDISRWRFTELANILEAVTIKPVFEGDDNSVRVMTIHASKGLEFDAVLLPFLNTALFKVDQLFAKDEQGTVIKAYVSVPQKLLHLSPTIKEMWMQRRDAQIEESLNLLYVACTRAKYSLTIWCEPSRGDSLTLGDVVHRTLTQDRYGELVSKRDSLKKNVSEMPRSVEAPRVFNPGVRKRALSVVSPSRSDDTSLDLPASWQKREQSALYGTIIHACMREIEWNGEAGIDCAVIDNVIRRLDPRGVMHGMRERFLSIVHQELVQKVLSKASYDPSALVYREKSFAVWSEEEKTLVSGTFDRVVLSKGRSQVHIIDFKTDADIKSAEELASRYDAQLSLYRKSAATLFGVSLDAVRSSLLLLSSSPLITNN
jgi:ATP-dependent helicase/nuclease subunit A